LPHIRTKELFGKEIRKEREILWLTDSWSINQPAGTGYEGIPELKTGSPKRDALTPRVRPDDEHTCASSWGTKQNVGDRGQGTILHHRLAGNETEEACAQKFQQ
jgi:hypothetical protein